MGWLELIPKEIRKKYEFHNFNNAVEILYQAHPVIFQELLFALASFSITLEDVIQSGGNESAIPKRFSSILHPMGWTETRISGDLLVKLKKRRHQDNCFDLTEFTISDYIDGHNIDFVKDRIALDLEWNSKDQTFDRDLFAFRTYYECGIISCGAIITRSASLNPVFESLGPQIKKKYGASTTWMGKLLPRLQSRRHGGCPILVIGITPHTFATT